MALALFHNIAVLARSRRRFALATCGFVRKAGRARPGNIPSWLSLPPRVSRERGRRARVGVERWLISSFLLGCRKEEPKNPNVVRTLQEGLIIDAYDANLPKDVCHYIRDFYNLFHSGVSVTFLEVLGKTESIDAQWKVFADKHQIPLSKAGRGDDATAKRLEKYLLEHHRDIFPTRDLFESSRSLCNFMKRFKLWPAFEHLVGEVCDYLAPGLTHRDEVKLIHFFSTQLGKFSSAEHFAAKDIQIIFLAGVKCLIPMEQKDQNNVNASWVLSKYGPEAEHMLKLITTDMTRDSKTYW